MKGQKQPASGGFSLFKLGGVSVTRHRARVGRTEASPHALLTPRLPPRANRDAQWQSGSGKKKPKVASLGEESNMYYHPEVRWARRGAGAGSARLLRVSARGDTLARGDGGAGRRPRRGRARRHVLRAQLKRWVERGKEDEAAADASPPPPPTAAPVFTPGPTGGSK